MPERRSRWQRTQDRAGGATRQRDRASARKQQLLDKLKASIKAPTNSVHLEEAPPARLVRDCEGYSRALDEISFFALGDADPSTISSEYRSIVENAVRVADSGDCLALLVWPPETFSPSAVAGLMTLAATASAKRSEISVAGAKSWARMEADPVRVAIFPYARSTHGPARRVQIDAQQTGEVNFEHFLRGVDDLGDPAKDYHHVMSRVKSLDGRAIDGEFYPEFRHPVLDEVIPHGPPSGKGVANSSLLWRTHRKTDIGKQARTGSADDPAKGRFFAFELRAGDRIGVAIRSIAAPLNLFLVDLTKTGRQRLGWNWASRAREAVECVQTIHPSAGILVVTDDPWSHSATRFDILGVRKYGKRGKVLPAKGKTVLGLSGGILTNGPEPEFEPVKTFRVGGFYGDTGRVSEDLRRLSAKVADIGDAVAADQLKDLGAMVRRSASLPGSLEEFSRFLEGETTTAVASDRLATYRSAGLVSDLYSAGSVASQVDVGGGIRKSVTDLMSGLTTMTPMSSLLDEAITPSLRSSSKSVFVFRQDMVAEFAAHRMRGIGKLVERLDSGMVVFGGGEALDAISASAPTSRNQFKRLVLVAPTRATILKFLARPWLPNEITVLADADTLAYAGRDAQRLSLELGSHAIAARLTAFSEAAQVRVREIGRHDTNLDKISPLDDFEPTNVHVIDLSGGARGDKQLLQFTMHNGQRILTPAGTMLVLRDDAAATTSFVECQASAVRAGDEVCVIGPAFVERARGLVNIRAAAAEEIRTYHEQVLERFEALPGASVAAKIRALAAIMGDPPINTDNARYWVDINREMDKPIHEVVPHAPQDRDTFVRFTAALGISGRMAENYWLWAIVAQRSHRMRSGNLFHDAFRGILTDPHAALARNSERQGDIRALRLMAEEHVSTVRSIERINAS